MPKMKTKKAVAARFRVTATGKLKRGHPGKRHNVASRKTNKRRRQLAKATLVDDSMLKMYKRLLCV